MKFEVEYVWLRRLRMKIRVIYGLLCILNVADVTKNTGSTRLKSLLFKKAIDFRQKKKKKKIGSKTKKNCF